MLFPTLDFALFFLVVFVASWSLTGRLETRKLMLLGASYFFYACWDWRFMALLAGSSALNYIIGLTIEQGEEEKERKRWMLLGVSVNLALLAFFKYYGFFLLSFGDMLRRAGLERDLPIMEIILPVGISFFTFQGISYVVDIYRRDIKAVRSPIDLFLYISFFPQLVAGPIVRASHFLPQLNRAPKLERSAVALGFMLILLGLFKKSVIANYIASDLVDEVFYDPAAFSTGDLLVACYGYAVQVYCDFSAYSDIAIGVAALLGYSFKANFDRPLGATSLQVLWQRWHISLSGFLRDYLYRPLRGGRRGGGGNWRIYRNTFLTMLIGGLWHGAAWTFVVWGAIHGGMLVLERIFKQYIRPPLGAGFARAMAATGGDRLLTPVASALSSRLGFLPRMDLVAVAGWFFTFHVFAISAIFFRSPDFTVATDYLGRLLAFEGGIDAATPLVVALIAGAIAVQFLPGDLARRAARRIEGHGFIASGLLLGFGLLLIELVSPPGVAPFIYFQF